MQKKKIGICFIIFVFFSILLYGSVNGNEANYSTTKVSYTENGSYVEYPQIEGLKDKEKQDAINKLLKDQVLLGAKDSNNDTFVDFSYPNYIYNFKTDVGLTNKDISSFWFTFDTHGEVDLGRKGVLRNMHRSYGITIDMQTGEKIELSDFMVIDERLINSGDGNPMEPDYDSDVLPIFHMFKDAFMIYNSEEEKDAYHVFTPQKMIDDLKDSEGETNWYIDKNKNIVFYFIKNTVKIPYTEISAAIYPKYLRALEE